MELHGMERKTRRVRMFLAVFRQALFAKFRGPRLERQTTGQ
jgi:hypothetical protein